MKRHFVKCATNSCGIPAAPAITSFTSSGKQANEQSKKATGDPNTYFKVQVEACIKQHCPHITLADLTTTCSETTCTAKGKATDTEGHSSSFSVAVPRSCDHPSNEIAREVKKQLEKKAIKCSTSFDPIGYAKKVADEVYSKYPEGVIDALCRLYDQVDGDTLKMDKFFEKCRSLGYLTEAGVTELKDKLPIVIISKDTEAILSATAAKQSKKYVVVLTVECDPGHDTVGPVACDEVIEVKATSKEEAKKKALSKYKGTYETITVYEVTKTDDEELPFK